MRKTFAWLLTLFLWSCAASGAYALLAFVRKPPATPAGEASLDEFRAACGEALKSPEGTVVALRYRARVWEDGPFFAVRAVFADEGVMRVGRRLVDAAGRCVESERVFVPVVPALAAAACFFGVAGMRRMKNARAPAAAIGIAFAALAAALVAAVSAAPLAYAWIGALAYAAATLACALFARDSDAAGWAWRSCAAAMLAAVATYVSLPF